MGGREFARSDGNTMVVTVDNNVSGAMAISLCQFIAHNPNHTDAVLIVAYNGYEEHHRIRAESVVQVNSYSWHEYIPGCSFEISVQGKVQGIGLCAIQIAYQSSTQDVHNQQVDYILDDQLEIPKIISAQLAVSPVNISRDIFIEIAYPSGEPHETIIQKFLGGRWVNITGRVTCSHGDPVQQCGQYLYRAFQIGREGLTRSNYSNVSSVKVNVGLATRHEQTN